MELILFPYLVSAACILASSLANNVTDSTSSPNSQPLNNNGVLDGKMQDLRMEYYDPAQIYTAFAGTRWKDFHPLAKFQTRGSWFDDAERSMNPFWGHKRFFGMSHPWSYWSLLFGEDDRFARRRYGPYERYWSDKYTIPNSQFGAIPSASPYYSNQVAPSFQLGQSAGAPPYYYTQPGIQYTQPQPLLAPDSYYRGQGQPLQQGFQSAPLPYDQNQLQQLNTQPQLPAPSSYSTERPALPNVQSSPVSTSESGRHVEPVIESQIMVSPKPADPGDQRAVSSSGQSESGPVTAEVKPGAGGRTTEAKVQPQYFAAG